MNTTKTGPVLRCDVTSPARGALDFDAVREVTAALRAPEPDVGAVLLASEGPHFCVGADVGELAASAGEADPRAAVEALAGDLHELVRALVEVPVPVVAVVRGWAAGAGRADGPGQRPGQAPVRGEPDRRVGGSQPRRHARDRDVSGQRQAHAVSYTHLTLPTN